MRAWLLRQVTPLRVVLVLVVTLWTLIVLVGYR